jgi:hypothetical protein
MAGVKATKHKMVIKQNTILTSTFEIILIIQPVHNQTYTNAFVYLKIPFGEDQIKPEKIYGFSIDTNTVKHEN